MPDTAIPLYTDRDLRQLRFWRRFWTWALPVLLLPVLPTVRRATFPTLACNSGSRGNACD